MLSIIVVLKVWCVYGVCSLLPVWCVLGGGGGGGIESLCVCVILKGKLYYYGKYLQHIIL